MMTTKVLAANEIHLWCARDEQITDQALLERYLGLLTAEERARHQRFHFQRHRHQYLVSRALLRCVLSLYADVDPAAWRFRNNDYGKPAIANDGCWPVFNLSHSERMVTLAVAADGDVGVDVEWMQRPGEMLHLAENYFAPAEIRQLRGLPVTAQRERFFDFWTLKEAYIKACGMGLSIPLHHFSYLFATDGSVDIAFVPEREDCPERWQFWQIQGSPEHKLALAHRARTRVPRALTIHEIVPLQTCIAVTPSFTHSLPPAL